MLSRHQQVWIAAGLVIVIVLAITAVRMRIRPSHVPVGPAPGNIPDAVATRPVQAISEPMPALTSPMNRFDDIAGQLAKAHDRETSRRLLIQLRSYLDTLPPTAASRAVQDYLATGKDVATELDLTVSPGGALGDASSLRVFLLGYLGEIDRAAAGALAKQILLVPTTADEWAICLRNVAWSDNSPATINMLRAKTREMLSNTAWRQRPSAGFLEAFDVIVHARATDLTPQLGELVRDKENRALAHAAYLTLDRLTIIEPVATLEQLVAQPDLMRGREQTRANFFGRADVREPQQRRILETYLLDPQREVQELQTFAGIFPNANYMVSNNLLTSTPTPDQEELAARDHASLKAVREWIADPRFANLKPHLETIRGRLETFVQQATTPAAR